MSSYPAPDAYFQPDLAPLVAALEGADGPAGPSLRYDPVYAQIREARAQDDPSLPMGEWTRPLKKADWRATETLCTDLLAGRSKDLQVAGWLAEAWVHRHAVQGLRAGAQLLHALADGFWDGVHPRIDDGDTDTRAAPLVWANDTLAQTLLLHVPLVPWPDGAPPFINLYDWQRAVTSEFGGAGARAGAQGAPASRADILEQAGRDPWTLVALDESLVQASAAWDALTAALDARLGPGAPSLSKVAETLTQLRQAVRSLLGANDPRDAPILTDEYAPAAPDPQTLPQHTPTLDTMSDAPPPATPAEPALPAPDGAIASRAEAYRLLERVADYLQRTEPHSPTPYLVKRAVAWGRLPLPELMQEVLREEGDLNRYFSMLGLRQE